ncbi:hypothetical protein [Limnohabitans sp.]
MTHRPLPKVRASVSQRTDKALPTSPWEQRSRLLMLHWQQRFRASPRGSTSEAA